MGWRRHGDSPRCRPRVGGFDEQVGPGARFPSGDDWDIAHRALLKGWHVYETADLTVLHHGFRTLEQGRAHMRRDWLAIGAFAPSRFAPATAAGWSSPSGVCRLRSVATAARRAALAAAGRPIADRRFTEGFVKGILTPVDRTTLLFQSRPS